MGEDAGRKGAKPVNLKAAVGLIAVCVVYVGAWLLLGRIFAAEIPKAVYWPMIWLGYVIFFTIIVLLVLTVRDLVRWFRSAVHR